MIDSSITFLDSGIGGLPYLDWIRKSNTGIPLSYVADTENFPYGEFSADGLRTAVVATVRRVLAAGTPRLLVIACNTASVTALDAIREIAPCPVVGTVPAVRPAATLSPDSPIGVLATQGTVDSPYLDRLIASYAPGRSVIRMAAGDIVRYVEHRWLDEGDDGAYRVIEPALNKLINAGVGSVVIGCTHFLHVLEPMRLIAGDRVTLFDSRDGVGRRILSLISRADKGSVSAEVDSAGFFYVTGRGESESRYRRFAALYGLDWSGELA